MPDKIKIDPNHPVGSLTAGNQQFTIAADTNHGKESIHTLINNDIATMARNGVKHIMIEYTAAPVAEIEQQYPDLAVGKTLRDKIQILEQKMKTASPAERYFLDDAHMDLKIHALLEDVYAKPPRLSNEEIHEISKGFVSSKAEDKKKSADNFAELLIRSRDAGIEVHFTGDRDQKARKALLDAKIALDEFTRANQKYADNRENSRTVIGFKIPDEDMVGQIMYMSKIAELSQAIERADEVVNQTREDPVAEQRRVDRMIALAKGEKSVIVWGSAHAYKKNDFNELLDARLAEEAQKAGRPSPDRTKVIELCDSRDDPMLQIENPEKVDEPDARYYINEGELEITPSGADSLEKAPSRNQGLKPVAALTGFRR